MPENSSRLIELRAVDPDFGLTRLALVGEVGGKQVLGEELLKTDGTPPPQAIAKYVFAPQRLGLKAGDELIYVALAADNRTNAAGSAEPNEATTSSHVIVVVPPVGGRGAVVRPTTTVGAPPGVAARARGRLECRLTRCSRRAQLNERSSRGAEGTAR